jgi:hypothetical protein
LPRATLRSGEFALLVRNDFESSGGSDVPLETAALQIQMPALGKGGLSNAGEPLILKDPTGQIRSSFPALASKRAGVSLARRQPDSFDDDAAAFGEHAAPGASPGRANQLFIDAD